MANARASKILLARTFEEATSITHRFQANICALIADLSFPRGGREDPNAGAALIREVSTMTDDLPVLVQSSKRRCPLPPWSARCTRTNGQAASMLKCTASWRNVWALGTLYSGYPMAENSSVQPICMRWNKLLAKSQSRASCITQTDKTFRDG